MDPKRRKLLALGKGNLIAAIGTGGITIQALNMVGEPGLKGFTLYAFFFGAIFAIVILTLISNERKTRGIPVFSAATALGSLSLTILLLLSPSYPLLGWPAWLFFSLLIFRNAPFIVARSLRTDAAATGEQNLSWVEMSYYAGMSLGAIIWPFISFAVHEHKYEVYISYAALITDCVFQFAAARIDAKAARAETASIVGQTPEPNTSLSPMNWGRYAQMAIAFVAISIGVEAASFWLIERLDAEFEELLSAATFASTYLGPALAAFLIVWFKRKKITIRLAWIAGKRSLLLGTAAIIAEQQKHQMSNDSLGERSWRPVPFSLSVFIDIIIIFFCVTDDFVISRMRTLLPVGVALAFLLYEVLYLVILDRIGGEAERAGYKGIVAITLCTMAVLTAVVSWLVILGKVNRFYVILISLIVTQIIMFKEFTIVTPEKKESKNA